MSKRVEERNRLIEAIRLTVEYVGLETLPPRPGWTWFDAWLAVDPQSFLDWIGCMPGCESYGFMPHDAVPEAQGTISDVPEITFDDDLTQAEFAVVEDDNDESWLEWTAVSGDQSITLVTPMGRRVFYRLGFLYGQAVGVEMVNEEGEVLARLLGPM